MSRYLLLAALASTALLHAEDKMVGGPFVVHANKTSATVVWVVESAKGGLKAEKTELTGLEPGKVQEYDARGEEQGKGSFKTAPSGAEPFQFIVYGDTRTRHDMHRRVVSAILRDGVPDFVMHTGDLVADGNENSMWPVFFDIERELLRQTVFFPSLGNHERNSPKYYEFFQVGKPYYSFDWGNAHFIVLNSDLGNVDGDPSVKRAFWLLQRKWLEDDLAHSQQSDFRFIMAHHPPMTAVARRQGDNPEMTALIPMFEKYRVSSGFFGHDHNYQHYLKKDVHYIITGGGGAPLYDVDKPPKGITLKVLSTEHFVKIRVDGKTAKVTVVGLEGGILDEFEIAAAAPRTKAQQRANDLGTLAQR